MNDGQSGNGHTICNLNSPKLKKKKKKKKKQVTHHTEESFFSLRDVKKQMNESSNIAILGNGTSSLLFDFLTDH